MIRKHKNILIISVLICLTAFYALTAYRMFNPNLTYEYKLYYIDKKLNKYVPDGGLKIGLGQEISLSENGFKYLGRGFTPLEKYASFEKCTLFFYIEATAEKLVLKFAETPAVQKIEINGMTQDYSLEYDSLVIENIDINGGIELYIEGADLKLMCFTAL